LDISSSEKPDATSRLLHRVFGRVARRNSPPVASH